MPRQTFFKKLTLGLWLIGSQAIAGDLSIHAINVGWGSAVLVEGPTGKHMLLDSGNIGEGTAAVGPYLRAEGVTSLDVIVLSHNHQDHSGGLSEISSMGFTAPVNYYNGSAGGSSTALNWESSVRATAITPGTVIDLGGGATATCIAANGRVIGQTANYSGGNENDNSVALLIQYGGFKYIWEGDLGGAADAEDTCSGRTTTQTNVEVPMIRAILPGGSNPLIPSQSVDVIHVGHHGSMSSTHPVYVNLAAPQVALINTGHGESSTWALPYTATVDHVLLGGVSGCAGVPAPLVLQTEDGDQNYNNQRSTSGYAVNNIKVRTDGTHFWVSSNDDNGVAPYIAAGNVTTERANAGIPLGTERVFMVHGGGSTANTVTATITAPSASTTIATGTAVSFTGSATDSSATATLSYAWTFGDGGTATGASAGHTYTNTGASPVSYTAMFTATDNTGVAGSATRVITVNPAAANTVTASIATPSGNITIPSGTTQSFAGSATDSASGATFSYAWTFGDGGSASGASTSHAFTNTGTTPVSYIATFTATDNTGATGSATRVITVNPAAANMVTASIATPSGNITIPSGTTQSFAGSATDSASGATFSYAWVFGDGATGTGASASHTYINTGASPLIDTVTFTATDQTGAAGSATRTITISPAPSGGGTTYNEIEPNDTMATANVVASNVTSIIGYFPSSSDNDDYFQVTLLAGHTLTVGMTGPTASGQDYDLYLYSSGGTLLTSSTNSGTTERMSYTNTNVSATKTLYIRVNRYYSYSYKTPYTLTLSR